MKRARVTRPKSCGYVGKGGLKLEFALRHFGITVQGFVCADLGCHRGGFTDCLLQQGALRVRADGGGVLLFIFSLCGFASAVVTRSVDPLVTMIGRDFAIRRDDRWRELSGAHHLRVDRCKRANAGLRAWHCGGTTAERCCACGVHRQLHAVGLAPAL